jgi:hypothetical protein
MLMDVHVLRDMSIRISLIRIHGLGNRRYTYVWRAVSGWGRVVVCCMFWGWGYGLGLLYVHGYVVVSYVDGCKC